MKNLLPTVFLLTLPMGPVPVCKGLGAVYRISMDAIIPDASKSVNEGGIEPLGGEREAYVFNQVQKLARKINSVSIHRLKKCPQKP